MFTATAHPLEGRINEIAPLLRKFAAHHTGTHYAGTVEDMAPEAQDVYQYAITEILRTCTPEKTKAYLLTLADWRMRNARTAHLAYIAHIVEEDAGDEDPEEAETILEMLADDQADPETILIEHESAEELAEVIRGMKPDHAVIARLLAQGDDVREIAGRLGLTVQAVYARIAKVREAFQAAGLSPVPA